jgi:hypothetical protein
MGQAYGEGGLVASIGKSAASRPLREPDKADPRWQEKLDRAESARKMGQQLRKGKTKSFRRAVGRTP